MGRLRDMWDRFYNMDHQCSCTRRGGRHAKSCQLERFVRAKFKIEHEIDRLEGLEQYYLDKAFDSLEGEDI